MSVLIENIARAMVAVNQRRRIPAHARIRTMNCPYGPAAPQPAR
jgi:hypothetical protein